MADRTCLGCGVEIIPGPRERNKRKWCSDACRVRSSYPIRPSRARVPVSNVYYGVCCICGRLHIRRRKNRPGELAVCRDATCVRAKDATNTRDWFRRYRAKTGKSYSTERYSEQRAARRAAAPSWRETNPAAAKAADMVRKERIDAARVQSLNPRTVFFRDGWVCQLCEGLVDESVLWPDPMSKSLDHVVPISLGGEHSMANTQLAHLRCNILKSNRAA